MGGLCAGFAVRWRSFWTGHDQVLQSGAIVAYSPWVLLTAPKHSVTLGHGAASEGYWSQVFRKKCHPSSVRVRLLEGLSLLTLRMLSPGPIAPHPRLQGSVLPRGSL